jgi:hypothetical protein
MMSCFGIVLEQVFHGMHILWTLHPGFLFSYIFHFSCLHQLKLSVVNVRLNFKTSTTFFLEYLEVHSQSVIGCMQEECYFILFLKILQNTILNFHFHFSCDTCRVSWGL